MSLRLKVLMVEDDADDALIFERRAPDSFRIHHVRTAEAGMDSLRGGGFDICFTDYHLTFASGLDFVRAARAAGFDLPIVVITGHAVESLGENALLAGATDFVQKDELSTNSIERTARWSLIRRHVETLRLREKTGGESTETVRPAGKF